jgi:peptidyl-prolyl cis-trans isomerase B (cyclophilin B)
LKLGPLVLAVLLALAGLGLHASAQNDPSTPPNAQSPSPADADFQALSESFRVLYRSIQNSRGITDDDDPGIRALLTRVEAFNAKYPDHVRGIALALQLSLWLEDHDQVVSLFERLMDLRPQTPEIAVSYLAYLESQGELEGEELEQAYQSILDRFPDNEDLAVAYVKYREKNGSLEGEALESAYRSVLDRFPQNAGAAAWLAKRYQREARYAEAIEIITAVDPDPEQQPELVYTLAVCQFCSHLFDVAVETLASIPDSAINRNRRLQNEIRSQRQVFEEYVTLWEEEQALRMSEAEADDLPRVQIITNRGPILVELFEDQAPIAVANFITLAESGFYDQTKFHRYEPDFMVQGGDPNTKPGAPGRPGMGGPGYFLPNEGMEPQHRNHFNDSIAMAMMGSGENARTAGSQFYLNHRPTPWLNGRHTVFGRVLEGQDIVRSLRKDDEIQTMIVVRKRDHDYSTYETIEDPSAAERAAAPPGEAGGDEAIDDEGESGEEGEEAGDGGNAGGGG